MHGGDGEHWERDLWLRYGAYRNRKAQGELPARQIRVAMEYPIGG